MRMAEAAGARLLFVKATAPEPVVRARLEARARDSSEPSDGRWEIYRAQKACQDPLTWDEPFVEVDTTLSEESLRDTLKSILQLGR